MDNRKLKTNWVLKLIQLQGAWSEQCYDGHARIVL